MIPLEHRHLEEAAVEELLGQVVPQPGLELLVDGARVALDTARVRDLYLALEKNVERYLASRFGWMAPYDLHQPRVRLGTARRAAL